MSNFETYTDKQIQDAIAKGHFDNLPGAGKPLNLDDEFNTPSELRLAYKILKDNDLAPEWIMLGRDLEHKINRFRHNVRVGWRAYQRSLRDVELEMNPDKRGQRRDQADSAWKLAYATFSKVLQKLNSDILTYNLKVPRGIDQRPLLDLDKELDKLRQG